MTEASPIRIGYFGDGPWATRALAHIADDKRFKIVFITPRFINSDQGLRAWAARLGVPFLRAENINAPEFIKKISDLGVDLLVSMSFDQILKKPIINMPRLGFINCHAGALPFYRGRNPLNWVLINGETSFGITVHYVDEGIDTGDIIAQDTHAIGPDDTYADLLGSAHERCAATLIRALTLIATGKAKPQKQLKKPDAYTYFSRRGSGDEWINWSWPSLRIHNLVRGITLPGPCARTFYDESVIAIVETQRVPDAPVHIGTDGQIIGRDATGNIIKTGDTVLRITKIARVNANDTLEKIESPNFPIGTRLGINLHNEFLDLRRRVRSLEGDK